MNRKTKPKTIQFTTPAQLQLLRDLRALEDEMEGRKAELQAQLNREVEQFRMRHEGIMHSLEEEIGFNPGGLDNYAIDTMYLEDHGQAFAYENKREHQHPLAGLLGGILGGDAPDFGDDTPTSH